MPKSVVQAKSECKSHIQEYAPEEEFNDDNYESIDETTV